MVHKKIFIDYLSIWIKKKYHFFVQGPSPLIDQVEEKLKSKIIPYPEELKVYDQKL